MAFFDSHLSKTQNFSDNVEYFEDCSFCNDIRQLDQNQVLEYNLIIKNLGELGILNSQIFINEIIAISAIRIMVRKFDTCILEGELTSLCVGEILYPNLPETFYIPKSNCVKTLVQAIQIFSGLFPAVDILNSRVNINLWNNMSRDNVITPTNCTSDAAIGFIEFVARNLQPTLNAYTTPLGLITTTIIAFAKKGYMIDRLKSKIGLGLRESLGVQIVFDDFSIRRVFEYYMPFIGENLGNIVNYYQSVIPPGAIKLQMALNQMRGFGLTSFNIIGKAMKMYVNFKWSKLCKHCPKEFKNYLNALNEINGNLYYGYRDNLGAASKKNIDTLAWICKELLIRLNGEVSLKKFSGWMKYPKNVKKLESMIIDYIKNRERSLRANRPMDAEVITSECVSKIYYALNSQVWINYFNILPK